MPARIKICFLFLILAQGAHSIEEYLNKLWDVFYPAKFLCNLISNNLEIGFLIINISIFVIGIISWLYIAKRENITAQILIWFFIIIEFINGIGHPIWALSEMNYVPGLISALILLPLDLYLVIQILKQPDNSTN